MRLQRSMMGAPHNVYPVFWFRRSLILIAIFWPRETSDTVKSSLMSKVSCLQIIHHQAAVSAKLQSTPSMWLCEAKTCWPFPVRQKEWTELWRRSKVWTCLLHMLPEFLIRSALTQNFMVFKFPSSRTARRSCLRRFIRLTSYNCESSLGATRLRSTANVHSLRVGHCASSVLCYWVQIVCSTWVHQCDLRHTKCHNNFARCYSPDQRKLIIDMEGTIHTADTVYLNVHMPDGCEIWNLSEQGGILHIWAMHNTCWDVLTLPQALVLKADFLHFEGSSAKEVNAWHMFL